MHQPAGRPLFTLGFSGMLQMKVWLSTAAVLFILITIPLARFTDHIVAEREKRERAQAF